MCRRSQRLLALLVCLFTLPVSAFDGGLVPENTPMRLCYGAAMVGMDSVINARLGVLPENGVELARNLDTGYAREAVFSTDLLNTIFNAYLWDGTPHSYAVSVFYQCAQRNLPMQRAQTD